VKLGKALTAQSMVTRWAAPVAAMAPARRLRRPMNRPSPLQRLRPCFVPVGLASIFALALPESVPLANMKRHTSC